MSDQQKMRTFVAELQSKIRKLLDDFSDGKLSTEQFNILYSRYDNQLAMATEVLAGADDGPLEGGDMQTYAIREATKGQALGMAIYHFDSGTILETLGDFDVDSEDLSPVLTELDERAERSDHVRSRTQRLTEGRWLAYITRRHTTAIALFQNEPAPVQITELERLHRDFEAANDNLLKSRNINPEQLAKPFLRFVKQRLSE